MKWSVYGFKLSQMSFWTSLQLTTCLQPALSRFNWSSVGRNWSRLCPYYRDNAHSCARLRSRLCLYYKHCCISHSVVTLSYEQYMHVYPSGISILKPDFKLYISQEHPTSSRGQLQPTPIMDHHLLQWFQAPFAYTVCKANGSWQHWSKVDRPYILTCAVTWLAGITKK